MVILRHSDDVTNIVDFNVDSDTMDSTTCVGIGWKHTQPHYTTLHCITLHSYTIESHESNWVLARSTTLYEMKRSNWVGFNWVRLIVCVVFSS